MIRFQLKPRFTQNPRFVSPLRVFPLRLSLQCAGFDSAHASRNMRMFFFLLPFPLWCSRSVCSVILTPSTFLYLTQVACQSTCFCANTIYTRNLSMFGLFQKPWFTRCFGLNSNPGLRCVKAHLPTKQNADSQKKTCFKCFTETPCFTQTSRKIMFLLRPSTLAAAMLSCTHLHFISCLCYTCLRRQNLFSCVHGPKSAPLSWLLLRFTACTCTLSLLCHVSALKVWGTQIALAVVAGGTRQRRLNNLGIFGGTLHSFKML